MDLRKALRVDSDAHAVAERGAKLIADTCREAVAARGKFTIALTGGSSPLEMYARLPQEPYRGQIDWERTEWFWGDERAVSPERAESNYGAAEARIFREADVPPARMHRMQGEREDLENAAREYEDIVRRLVPANATGVPSFDLVLIGIGNDGHVLSLYPQCPQIAEPTGLVVALRNPPMKPAISRITFTSTLLLAARRIVVFAHGAAKADALAALMDGPLDEAQTPAQLIRRAAGDVMILADPASAVRVKR